MLFEKPSAMRFPIPARHQPQEGRRCLRTSGAALYRRKQNVLTENKYI